jgi:hypothetical protein
LFPMGAQAQGSAPTIDPAGTGNPPSVVVCVDPTAKQTFTASGGTAPDPTQLPPCPPWSKDGDPFTFGLMTR